MSLLQISEPGESPEPHQRKIAVGIDLGTTHSLVATVRSSSAEILADGEGRPLLPSIVRYHADGRVDVGYEARAAQSDDPGNTIVSVKRFMGRGVADVAKYGALPYRFTETPGMVSLETAAGPMLRLRYLPTVRPFQRNEPSIFGNCDQPLPVAKMVGVLYR